MSTESSVDERGMLVLSGEGKGLAMSIRLKSAAFLLLGAAIVANSGPLFFIGCSLLLLHGASKLWLRATTRGLSVSRGGETRAFYGSQFTLEVTIHNGSALPLPWLRLRETLPAGLVLPNHRLAVAGLAPGRAYTFRYTLPARQRGLHPVGPLYLTYGDPFGLAERVMVAGVTGYVLVYPRLIPLSRLGLPAAALLGTLSARRPLLGDPSRVVGARDYHPGDPVRDVHWTATAASGRLQVKQYEPATEVQTTIFLDLDASSYQGRAWRGAHGAELAVTCAASVSWALAGRRQSVGLVATGMLQATGEPGSNLLPLAALTREPAPSEAAQGALSYAAGGIRLAPRKGRAHTMHLLEALARLELAPGGHLSSAKPFERVLAAEAATLAWGATVVVVTGTAGEGLWAALHRLREAGVRVLVLLVEEGGGGAAARTAARLIGVTLCPIWHDHDLERETF